MKYYYGMTKMQYITHPIFPTQKVAVGLPGVSGTPGVQGPPGVCGSNSATMIPNTVIAITTEGLTAYCYPKYNIAPLFGAGNIVFTEKMTVALTLGQQFNKRAVSCTKSTLGKIGTPVLQNNNKILVPKGSKYYRTDDACGLVKETKCDQYFLFEQGAHVSIPGYVPYFCDEDEECFTKETVIHLA